MAKDLAFQNAVRELGEKSRRRPVEIVPIFKRFRKIHEHRLLMRHNAGGGGRELARQRSDLVDVIIRELFDRVVESVSGKQTPEQMVLAAFGGYGRREMNPFSDVDVMFLMGSGRPGMEAEEIIRRMTTILWDVGFKVGHSVRSISQAIRQANEDMLTKTSMVECRFLRGSRELFNEFRERFDKECIRGREENYVIWRLQNQHELHEKFGPTVYMQEPNVKSGCGGLRDYQNLLWMAYFKERITSTSGLVTKKILRESERRRLDKGYDFLLRVRTQMHYLNGRPSDSLSLQLQGRVATAFQYPQRSMLRRCEAFMRDYYSHARDIHLTTGGAVSRLRIEPERRTPVLLSLLPWRSRNERFDGFTVRDGLLFPQSRELFNEDPARLMRAFQHAQIRNLELSPQLRDLINRRLKLVDRTFQYARATREAFLAILSRKGEVGRILRAMHDLSFLGRYLPEFGALTCLVQHEFFHRYTADEHTLVCVDKLDAVLFSRDEKLAGYRSLFQKLEDPAVLYLALLLHDTGKAANRRSHEEISAEMARKVSRRLQLSPERRRMLITLVNSHMALSHMAQTRNLDDLATVVEFAGIAGSRKVLDALMLLTLADGMGTSDQKWSDWKESLVWTLYRYTVDYLENGPQAFEQQRRNLTELREECAAKLPKDYQIEIQAHFEHMPDRYFRTFAAADIREHLKLFREFFAQRAAGDVSPLHPAFRWMPRVDRGHTEVWVCGWDRPGLLQKIAGAFLSAQLNILSADVFTRGDNLVLDVFRVCDTGRNPVTEAKDQALVEKRLADALQQEDFDFKPLLGKEARMRYYHLSQEIDLPTKVVLDNTSHPVYSLVEVQTPDRLGLLYDLLRALGDAGVSIELSRITTEMEVAMDTFYVTCADGGKLTAPHAIRELQELLQVAAVGGGDGVE